MEARRLVRPSIHPLGSVSGSVVRDCVGLTVGRIEELMLDLDRNRIAYAVLSLNGRPEHDGKLFAVPWEILRRDAEKQCFVLEVPRERLSRMEGFDPAEWPEFSDHRWAEAIHRFWLREFYETGSDR